MITLRLPYPVSANRYWRKVAVRNMPHSAKLVLSHEAKMYRYNVGWLAKAQGLHGPADGPLSVSVQVLPKTTKNGAASGQILDLDNAWKVASDALQGVAYDNDRQVKRLLLEYGDPTYDGGLLVRIGEFEKDAEQKFAR